MAAWLIGPVMCICTVFSLPKASVSRFVASRLSSGVSPAASDLVGTKVT